jgi:hypothetical protein
MHWIDLLICPNLKYFIRSYTITTNIKTSDLKVYQHKNKIYEITETHCTYTYVAQRQYSKCSYGITVSLWHSKRCTLKCLKVFRRETHGSWYETSIFRNTCISHSPESPSLLRVRAVYTIQQQTESLSAFPQTAVCPLVPGGLFFRLHNKSRPCKNVTSITYGTCWQRAAIFSKSFRTWNVNQR